MAMHKEYLKENVIEHLLQVFRSRIASGSENRKNWHENEILKANEPVPYV
jgi:hypothetical protein